MLSENFKKDDGVTSVVGEMLILALVLIVVALLATSAFNMLPGARDKVADVAFQYNPSEKTITFWHKGGDWIERSEMTVTLSNDSQYITLTEENSEKDVFDLGDSYKIKTDEVPKGTYEVRLTTLSSVIYSGKVTLT